MARLAVVQSVAQARPANQGANHPLSAPLREACAAARDHGLHVEQLLIILKQSWQSVTETQHLERGASEEMLGEIVTQCIEEYYRLDATT